MEVESPKNDGVDIAVLCRALLCSKDRKGQPVVVTGEVEIELVVFGGLDYNSFTCVPEGLSICSIVPP